jgi:membrane-associated protease RseP (regulator of RpoE activity)
LFAFILGFILFALLIGLSIAAHEAGHMISAKAFGMKVRRYYIGFGPKVFSFKRGETEYGLKAIPAGGFCDIAGMTALDEVTEDEDKRAMWRRPLYQRVIVLASGALVQFLIGLIIVFGMTQLSGIPNNGDRPVIGAISACAASINPANHNELLPCPAGSTSPAQRAGIQVGDEVKSIGGKAVGTWTDLIPLVQKSSGPTQFVVERDKKLITTTVDVAQVQRVMTDNSVKTVGVFGAGEQFYFKYGVLGGVGATLQYTGDSFAKAINGIKKLPSRIPDLIHTIAGDKRTVDTPISVVGASRIGGQAVELGIWPLFWSLLASLNFFVGVFNLVPLLPLDGGHIAVAVYERIRDLFRKVRGKVPGAPVDYTKLSMITVVVVILGAAYMLLTITADIVNPLKLGG